MKLIFSALCISFIFICLAQESIKTKLTSPVKHPITLSGSFGELRTGHFHSGLDIRSSKGASGDSIFSIASGYISRIKVEPGGYGNSLYITHTDGLTSVYAHLQKFRSDIMEIASSHQSATKRFTIDFYPQEKELPVLAAEFIGFMGNSGKSFGPHLHFEIRDTKTDQLINPILFGIKPKDTRAPILEKLAIYQYDSLSNLTNLESIDIIQRKAGDYTLENDTIILSDDLKTTVSIKAFDRMNGSWNKNGIYSLKVFKNKELITSLLFEDLLFQDSDYIGYVSDPYQIKNQNNNFHMISISSDSLSISKIKESKASDSKIDNYKIQVKDIEGNESNLDFSLNFKKLEIPPVQTRGQNLYTLHPDTVSIIKEGDFLLHFQKNTIPKKIQIHVSNINNATEKFISIGKSEITLDKPFEIHYKLNKIDSIHFEKMHFAKCNSKGTSINLGSSISQGWISAQISSFGNYSIQIDTTAPTIRPEFNVSRMSQNQELSFIIKDDRKASRKDQYLKYNFYVDNELKIMRYDLKNDRVSGRPFTGLTASEHELKLVVTDCMNNHTIFTKVVRTY